VTRPVDRKPSGEGSPDSDLETVIRDLYAFADTPYNDVGENENYDFASEYDRTDRERFRELFKNAAVVLQATVPELAGKLMISHPTVERWTTGKTAPLPPFRRTYIRALADVGKERLSAYSYAL
jgi:hypothetical protein